MKIGQALKLALNDISNQSWQKLNLWDGRIGIEISVDPKFIRAVEILLAEAIKNLDNSNRFLFMRGNEIYLRILSYHHEYNESPSDANVLVSELNKTLQKIITCFAETWKKSNSIPNSPHHYGKDTLTMEHDSFRDSDVLLRIISQKLGYSSSDLTVYDTKFSEDKNLIFGKKDAITDLVTSINDILSPTSQLDIDSSYRSETLKQKCVSMITNQLRFYKKQLPNIPKDLQVELKEKSMEPITAAEQLEKYKGKIIIYSVNCTKIHCYTGFDFSLSEDSPNLLIGMIGDTTWRGEERGETFELSKLMKIDLYSTQPLYTANLKYGNFKLLLPDVSELETIKNAILNKQVHFFNCKDEDVITRIDNQMKLASCNENSSPPSEPERTNTLSMRIG